MCQRNTEPKPLCSGLGSLHTTSDCNENQILYSHIVRNTKQLASNARNGFRKPMSSVLYNPAGKPILLTSCTKEFLWFLFLTFQLCNTVPGMGDFLTCLRMCCSWIKPSVFGQETFLISHLLVSPGQNLWVDIQQRQYHPWSRKGKK